MDETNVCDCPACQQVSAPWVKTPWWHPYRWFGLDMRQRIRLDQINGVRESCWWHYGASRRLAHDLLRRMYGPVDVDPSKQFDGVLGGNRRKAKQ